MKTNETALKQVYDTEFVNFHKTAIAPYVKFQEIRIWSWGGGIDSTAGIEKDILLGRPIADIIFADTGSEKDLTYKAGMFYIVRWSNLGIKVTVLTHPDGPLLSRFAAKKHVTLGYVNNSCSSTSKRDLISKYIYNTYRKASFKTKIQSKRANRS